MVDGLGSLMSGPRAIPVLVAAASRHNTARGSGFFMTGFAGSREETAFRLLLFIPKLAYGLGSSKLNATTRSGASFSAPASRRGAGMSLDIDAIFAASALCVAEDEEGQISFAELEKKRTRNGDA